VQLLPQGIDRLAGGEGLTCLNNGAETGVPGRSPVRAWRQGHWIPVGREVSLQTEVPSTLGALMTKSKQEVRI
jgi:hypothetical protein